MDFILRRWQLLVLALSRSATSERKAHQGDVEKSLAAVQRTTVQSLTRRASVRRVSPNARISRSRQYSFLTDG